MSSDYSPDVLSLRSELRAVRSEVSNLRHEVGRVSGMNDRIRRIEEKVEPALEDLARKQAATQNSLDQLRELYERDRIVAQAYQELTVIERQWQARFGRYKDARDMAASIIDVVASGHINRAVILDVTERLAIHTPRYWVAQATLAVAAWLNNDRGQHDQALEHALALDFEKTALFMALLLRDQDRDNYLQEWLAAYLSKLTPVSLPRHFQVVIDAATGSVFGGGAAPRLVRQLGEWYAEEGDRQDISEAAVAEWKRRLLSLGARSADNADFSLLTASDAGWQALAPRYEVSRAIRQGSRYFRDRFETGASVSEDVRGDLAELLGKLARTEDPEEEELLGAMRMYRAVTQANGDPAEAQAMVVAEEQGRKLTLNIVAMVSQSAFPSSDGGRLPPPTVSELLAIMLNGTVIATAADELRDDLPDVVTVDLGVGERPWECHFDCGNAASRSRPALHIQAEEQVKQVCAQIQREADRRQGRLRWLKSWGCPSGLAAAVGLGGATFIPGAPPELMIPAFVVAVPAILGISRLPRVVRRAKDQTEAVQRAVSKQIHAAAEQLADLWDADRESAEVHLPALRGYLLGLTEDSVRAAVRPLGAVPLPRTRDFPEWTPHPPRAHTAIEADDDPPPFPGSWHPIG
jgi:hypothetical protein